MNTYHGNVAAVLLSDGEVVAAVEEERFRRVKHWAGFPTYAIRACLDMAGIDGSAVEHVAVSRSRYANIGHKALFLLQRRPSLRLVMDRLRSARRMAASGEIWHRRWA